MCSNRRFYGLRGYCLFVRILAALGGLMFTKRTNHGEYVNPDLIGSLATALFNKVLSVLDFLLTFAIV